jgi:hypothetical protein
LAEQLASHSDATAPSSASDVCQEAMQLSRVWARTANARPGTGQVDDRAENDHGAARSLRARKPEIGCHRRALLS